MSPHRSYFLRSPLLPLPLIARERVCLYYHMYIACWQEKNLQVRPPPTPPTDALGRRIRWSVPTLRNKGGHDHWRPHARSTRGKKLSQGDIEKRTAPFAATFPALKMDIPFQPSRPWRGLRELWSARSITSFTTARNNRNCRTSPSENHRVTLHGAALVKKRVTSTSFAGS